MQDIDIYDLEFYELSAIADDPKKLEQLKNHFYDPEFDEWLEEFEMEQEEKIQNSSKEKERMPDMDDIAYAQELRQQIQNSSIPEDDEYEISQPVESEISDWEEVE